MLRNKPDQVFF